MHGKCKTNHFRQDGGTAEPGFTTLRSLFGDRHFYLAQMAINKWSAAKILASSYPHFWPRRLTISFEERPVYVSPTLCWHVLPGRTGCLPPEPSAFTTSRGWSIGSIAAPRTLDGAAASGFFRLLPRDILVGDIAYLSNCSRCNLPGLFRLTRREAAKRVFSFRLPTGYVPAERQIWPPAG